MATDGEKKRKESSNRMGTGSTFMTILLVVLNVFLLGLVIVTAVLKEKELDSYRGDSKFCVLRDDVRLHPFVPMSEFQLSNDGSVYCLKDNKNLDALVEKFTEHWYKVKLAEESPKFALCANQTNRKYSWLKLQGVEQRSDEAVSNRQGVLRWRRSHSDGGGDLRYQDGYIHVQNTGVYRVYSQLVRDRPNSGKSRVLMHRVILSHGEHNRIIIDSTRSECRRNGTVTWDTNYVGTVEQLMEGDKVAVMADVQDDYASGRDNMHQNVFGMIRI